MQLTIEVLPAPFGPMIENNSPSLTPKETSVSARTPPKRNETPRTSSVLSKTFLQKKNWRVFALLSVFRDHVSRLAAILYRRSRPNHATNVISPPTGTPDAIGKCVHANVPCWVRRLP